MSKPTISSLKSLIKKNKGNLFIHVKTAFDGMYDCCMPTGQSGFQKANETEKFLSNTLGIEGVWVVRGGDYVTAYDDGAFTGYEVYNCCGTFILGVQKVL